MKAKKNIQSAITCFQGYKISVIVTSPAMSRFSNISESLTHKTSPGKMVLSARVAKSSSISRGPL
jgi:hypothetical protein